MFWLAIALQQEFGDRIRIVKQKDTTVTGKFEVSVQLKDGTMRLVHSRSKGDGGKCDTDEQVQRVVKRIRQALKDG